MTSARELSLNEAAHSQRVTPEELAEEYLDLLDREAEYKRLPVEIVEVREEMVEKIRDLGWGGISSSLPC